MPRRSTRRRKAKRLKSSVSPMETETEEMLQYNGDVSSSEDSLNSDHSRAISEMYRSFDVEDMTKEEFKSMLENAPPLEVHSIIQSSSVSSAASSSEASSISRSSGPAHASEEWDPELPVTLNRIGHFMRKHPFNKDPLAIHTISQRRAYTRAIYDYARALQLTSSQAAEIIKEARRTYRKSRHVARILSWVDAAAKAGRTMEDELERIRFENGWDTDELEGDFDDEDEELETSFGTEIDDTADILREPLTPGDPAHDVVKNTSHLNPSDIQVKRPGSETGISKTKVKEEGKRARKRGRESATDDEQGRRSKKAVKRSGQSDVVAGKIGMSSSKLTALDASLPATGEDAESVKRTKSGLASEQQPPTKLSKSQKKRLNARQKKDMSRTLSADQTDPLRTVGSKSGAAESSFNQRKTLRANPLAGKVTELSRPLQETTATEQQGDTNPDENLASTGDAKSTEVNHQARKDKGVLKRVRERKQNNDHTKPLSDKPPAVRGGRQSVRNQDFVNPNDAPNTTSVEGAVLSREEGADGVVEFTPGAESYARHESADSLSKASDDSSVVITRSSPPTSAILEESPKGARLGCSGHTDLAIRPKASGVDGPGGSKVHTTPSKSLKRVTPLTSPYFKKKPNSKRRLLKHSASCVPFPPLSQQTFGLIQEKLAHEPFKLLVAVTFLNRTRGIHAIPVFYSLMDRYPTPADLAAADEREVASQIRHLGLQNTRARRYIRLAQAWVEDPPVMGRRHRKLHYPNLGDGKDIKRGEIIDDEDERVGAWEIAHLPTTGPYAIDSWRIFCRDELRKKVANINGENTDDTNSEPEWMKVVPLDKELRAYLKWRWLKEGWDWDPRTGRKARASQELVERAERGELHTEGAMMDSESEYDGQVRSVGILLAEEAVREERHV